MGVLKVTWRLSHLGQRDAEERGRAVRRQRAGGGGGGGGRVDGAAERAEEAPREADDLRRWRSLSADIHLNVLENSCDRMYI
jgi:hypothetical protein